MLVEEMFPVTFQQVVVHGIMDGLAKNIVGYIASRAPSFRNSERHVVVVKDNVAYTSRRKWSRSVNFIRSLFIEM